MDRFNSRKMLTAILLVFWFSNHGAASETPTEENLLATPHPIEVKELPAESVGDHMSELIKQINQYRASFDVYLSSMNTASQEDRFVLETQLTRLQNQGVEAINQLADALMALEETAARPALRNQVEDLYRDVAPGFARAINRLREKIDTVRSRRLDEKISQRYDLEMEVRKHTVRVDELFEMFYLHVEKMKKIGMDAGDYEEKLTTLLSERAEELSGRIALSLARVDGLKERMRKKLPDDKEASTLHIIASESLLTNTSSMANTLALMDRLGLDPDLYKAQLAAATQDIGKGLLDTGVAAGIVERALKAVTHWFATTGPSFLRHLIVFVLILFVFRLVARFVRKGLEKAFHVSALSMSKLMRQTIVAWSSHLIMIIGVMVALSQLGISLGPMLAGLGIAGFIVGFALQDTLSNFVSGMMILIYRPFDTGDTIDAGGVFGKVETMSLVTTTLLTFDNQTIVVPNNKIWGGVIKNITAQKIRRVDMVFGISYGDDIPKAEKILSHILDANEKVLDDPEPVIHLHTLGASSVDFVVRPWVKVDDYWNVYWDVTREVKLRFDQEGISIPFPQQDVHVYHENRPLSAVE